MIMVHGDNRGLVVPPKIAPTQLMIVPIAQHKDGVLDYAYQLKEQLSGSIRTGIDASDKKPGWKFNEYEMKGIPLRLEVGPRDIEQEQVVLVRRDTGEKQTVHVLDLEAQVQKVLTDIQDSLYEKALKHREEKTSVAKTYDEFKETLNNKNGFIKAMWCGDQVCEDFIKDETGATSRCMPFVQQKLTDQCVCCEKDAKHLVYWAKAY
jgi:prolyl-tRNA synthetase